MFDAVEGVSARLHGGILAHAVRTDQQVVPKFMVVRPGTAGTFEQLVHFWRRIALARCSCRLLSMWLGADLLGACKDRTVVHLGGRG